MAGRQRKATGKGPCNAYAIFSILLNNGNESLHLIPDTMEKNLKFIALRVLPEMFITRGFAYRDSLSYLGLSSVRKGLTRWALAKLCDLTSKLLSCERKHGLVEWEEQRSVVL